LNYEKFRDRHRRISSVKNTRKYELKPLAQATPCFKYVNLEWKLGGHLCSFSWK